MSALREYPAYKVVKARWLTRLPMGWELTRVRYVCDVTTGSGDTVDAEPDGPYPFYVRSQQPLASIGYTFDDEAVLTAGDGAVGEVFHHVSGKFHAHQRVYVLHRFRGVEPRFFYYYFSALFRLMCNDGSARTTVDSVRRWMVTDMPVALPPLPQQRAIANFLDEQTSRIDTLIGKQTQLIDTLRERRDAVITAATNPPDAKRVPLKRISRPITDGAHISPDTVNGKHDFVSTRDIKNGSIDFDGSLKTSDESFAYMVQTGCRPSRGDILFAKDGTVGTTAVVLSDHPFVVASSLVIISVRPSRASTRFVEYALRAAPTRHQATAFMRGAGLPGISVANVGRIEITLPPLGNQERIAANLDQQTARIDALIAKTEEHIALARERRSALITAAVTGKIVVHAAGRAATVGA